MGQDREGGRGQDELTGGFRALSRPEMGWIADILWRIDANDLEAAVASIGAGPQRRILSNGQLGAVAQSTPNPANAFFGS